MIWLKGSPGWRVALALVALSFTALPAAANDPAMQPAPHAELWRLAEIEQVFDRNRPEIDLLYEQALKDNPSPRGELLLEVTVAACGDITQCRVACGFNASAISNGLKGTALQEKIVACVRLFHLRPRGDTGRHEA
jgi:hypothetical protein